MPFTNPFGSPNSSANNTASSSGFVNPFAGYTPPSPTPTPQPVVQPQKNITQQASDFLTGFEKQAQDIFSGIGNYVKTNILDNPSVKDFVTTMSPKPTPLGNKINQTLAPIGKNIENAINPILGTVPGNESPLGYKYTGNTVKDIGNLILETLPALGIMGGGEVVQGFSKTRAVIGAVTQAGVQIAAGMEPADVLKNLPFSLGMGFKLRGELIKNINSIKEDALSQAKDNLPAVLDTQTAKTEAVGSNLVNTPLGKEILKTAFEADKQGNKVLISHDPSSDLTTPGGLPVKVEIQPKTVFKSAPSESSALQVTSYDDRGSGVYYGTNKSVADRFGGEVKIGEASKPTFTMEVNPKANLLDLHNEVNQKAYDTISSKFPENPTGSEIQAKAQGISSQLKNMGYDGVEFAGKGEGEGFVIDPKDISVKPTFNKDIVTQGEQQLKNAYSTVDKNTLEQHLYEIYTEMDMAQAGSRTVTDEGKTIGSNSTFPKWIPEDLRQKPLLDKVTAMIQNGVEGFKYPDKNQTAQRALLDTVFRELDQRTGVDTSKIRSAIIDEYGKNTKEPTTISQTSQNTQVNPTESPKASEVNSSSNEGNKGTTTQPAGVKSAPTQNGITEEPRSAGTGKSVATDNTARNGTGVSKLTSDIQNRLNSDFKDIPGYEKMNMKDQAYKAVDLMLKDPQLAKEIAMGRSNPEGDLQAGSVFTAVREKAFSEGDIATLHDLAQTDLAGKAGQALKSYDTFNKDDPVSAMKEVIDARTKDIESKSGKSIEQIQKDNIKTIETEVKKAVSKGDSGSKGKLANFIKSLQC